MKITLLPSALGNEAARQYLTSFLINETVAVDAGSLGFWHRWEDQARVEHIFLSHSHIDHVASLPIFLENVYEYGPHAVTVHGSAEVLESLQRDVFNDRVWPDFVRLSSPHNPLVRLSPLQPGQTVTVAGLRLTTVPVAHSVPTLGFVVEDATSTVLIAGDTGPTEYIWQVANSLPRLQAVFLECSFPNALEQLALISGHLTPATFAGEVSKLSRPVPVHVVHIKPRFFDEVTRELAALQLPQVAVAQMGIPYCFE